MSDDDKEIISSFTSIPDFFYSFETGNPFSHCIDCEKYLLEDGTVYGVQKVYRGSEVILEFAHCGECYQKLFECYSRESQNNIWDFFLDRVDLVKRRKHLLKNAWTDLDPWISNCVTCNTPKNELDQFIVCGLCDGPDLLFYYLPYMICEQCELAINECLSKKSRDIWDEWIEQNFDVPPSVRQEITDGKIVII